MTLKIKNQLTKKIYTFDVEDINDSKMFFHFNVQLPDGIDEGQYNYALYDENNVQVANGILQVGKYDDKKEVTTAYTKNNEYIQYNG